MNTSLSSKIASLFGAVCASAVTAAVLVVAPAQVQAQTTAKVVADYTVFVDPPTGFVFVKLPAGWKFVAKVEGAEIARLPGNVVTALLNVDPDDERATDLALADRAAAPQR